MAIQDSLSQKLSKLQRKLYDRQIDLMGGLTQVIRLKVNVDKYMDEDIKVINNDIIEVVLDLPKEIPTYRLNRNNNTGTLIEPTGLYLYEILPIEGYSKFEDKVEKGDIIIKRIYDEKDIDNELLLILRVSETFGGLNNNQLVWKKFNCSPHNMTLTDEIISIIKQG